MDCAGVAGAQHYRTGDCCSDPALCFQSHLVPVQRAHEGFAGLLLLHWQSLWSVPSPPCRDV